MYPDTVGELQTAENCASQMPLLKTQEHVESKVATVGLSGGNRFANSIYPEQTPFGSISLIFLIYPPNPPTLTTHTHLVCFQRGNVYAPTLRMAWPGCRARVHRCSLGRHLRRGAGYQSWTSGHLTGPYGPRPGPVLGDYRGL